MYRLALCLLMIAFVGISGCTQIDESVKKVQNETLNISSSGMTYPAYLAAPESVGKWPGIVLIHSFRGLEPGYKTLVDKFAGDGFVVIAPEWQTFNKTPDDETVSQLIKTSVMYLKTRTDVDVSNLGLTGFCAGGRYTMLFLPQMDFKSGVAFYGFPYSGGFLNESKPADFMALLKVPMLVIHGTYDQSSKISEIYRYAEELNATGKYFEMKVYQGEPHGFMIEDGRLSESFAARDACWQMATFFNRTLKQL
ncbi:MAG: dienelactone hydrolase family protein [Methanothrix sp.]|nr:dienelactone hydrolase family protein [Methanothrix sp.]